MPACQLLGPEAGAALPLACAVLVVLLLALIALGFGPLRAWLGPSAWRWPSRAGSIDSEDSLLGAWRLYRQVGQAESGCRGSLHARYTMPSRTSSGSAAPGGG